MLQAKTTSCMARTCELFKLQMQLWGAEQPAVLRLLPVRSGEGGVLAPKGKSRNP